MYFRLLKCLKIFAGLQRAGSHNRQTCERRSEGNPSEENLAQTSTDPVTVHQQHEQHEQQYRHHPKQPVSCISKCSSQ